MPACALLRQALPFALDGRSEAEGRGFSLGEIWERMVERVALYGERARANSLSLNESLALQEKILRLEKQTEAAAWKEKQPQKIV